MIDWLRSWWVGILLISMLVALVVFVGYQANVWGDDSIKCLQSGGVLHSSGFLGLGHVCLNSQDFHVIELGVVR